MVFRALVLVSELASHLLGQFAVVDRPSYFGPADEDRKDVSHHLDAPRGVSAGTLVPIECHGSVPSQSQLIR